MPLGIAALVVSATLWICGFLIIRRITRVQV
jgi:hypothetical protein